MPKSQQTLRLTLNRNLPERQGVENDFQVKKTRLLKEKDLVRAGQIYGSEGSLTQLKSRMGGGKRGAVGRGRW